MSAHIHVFYRALTIDQKSAVIKVYAMNPPPGYDFSKIGEVFELVNPLLVLDSIEPAEKTGSMIVDFWIHESDAMEMAAETVRLCKRG